MTNLKDSLDKRIDKLAKNLDDVTLGLRAKTSIPENHRSEKDLLKLAERAGRLSSQLSILSQDWKEEYVTYSGNGIQGIVTIERGLLSDYDKTFVVLTDFLGEFSKTLGEVPSIWEGYLDIAYHEGMLWLLTAGCVIGLTPNPNYKPRCEIGEKTSLSTINNCLYSAGDDICTVIPKKTTVLKQEEIQKAGVRSIEKLLEYKGELIAVCAHKGDRPGGIYKINVNSQTDQWSLGELIAEMPFVNSLRDHERLFAVLHEDNIVVASSNSQERMYALNLQNGRITMIPKTKMYYSQRITGFGWNATKGELHITANTADGGDGRMLLSVNAGENGELSFSKEWQGQHRDKGEKQPFIFLTGSQVNILRKNYLQGGSAYDPK